MNFVFMIFFVLFEFVKITAELSLSRLTRVFLFFILSHTHTHTHTHCTESWYHFNDSTVKETSPENVANAHAYILFYVQRNANSKYSNNDGGVPQAPRRSSAAGRPIRTPQPSKGKKSTSRNTLTTV